VFQLVKKNSEIAPAVLTEHGKVCTFSSYSSHCDILTIHRRRTPTPTSTPPPESSSTTTASSSLYTTPSPLASAVLWDHWYSSSGTGPWGCPLSDPRVSTCWA
jgi:hypothetical protein